MPSRIPPWAAISTEVPVAVQATVPEDIKAAVPVAIQAAVQAAVTTAVSAESLTVVCEFEDHLQHFEPKMTEVCRVKGPPPAEVRS